MAKAPKSILKRMRESPADSRRLGSNLWIARHERRDDILATFEEYLKGRVDGSITMGLAAFTSMLLDEFGYPFEWHSTRAYMARYHRDLFEQQVRRRE